MTARPKVSGTFVELTDTPASITASRPVVGNSGGTALEFGASALSDYLKRDGTNTITGAIDPDTDNSRDFGDETLRFRRMWGRMGIFVGGDGTIDANFRNNAQHGGVIAGSQNLTGTQVHDMFSGNAAFPSVALIGNTYNAYAGSTSIFRNTGGGSVQFGSAYTTANGIQARIETTAFGCFTVGYAWAYGSNSTILNEASGAFVGGYPATASSGGGSATVRAFAGGQGSFVWGRTPYNNANGSGARQIYSRGPGQFILGHVENTGTAACQVQGGSSGKGAFVAGAVFGSSTFAARLRTGANDSGAFAQGYCRASTQISAIEANEDGAFAQGYCFNGNILATGKGSLARGRSRGGYSITASGSGSAALGDSNSGAITASAQNAFQWGTGVNALADSLAVGDISGTGIRIAGGGAPVTPVDGDVWKASGDMNFRSNGATVGPFNQPSVTGSRAGNAALASLLTQLAAINIVADNSTA